MKNTLMFLMTTMGLILLMSSSQGVEAKKPKKYIGENGGDFEFIDEVSTITKQHESESTTKNNNN